MILLALALSARMSVQAQPAPARTPSPSADAKETKETKETKAQPAANPADVASIHSIVAACYDVISGPAGKKRDWDRMRSLFAEGARLIPSGVRPSGEVGARVLDVNGYIERSSPFFEKEGFYERELAHRVDRFGHIAQVFSTYESRHAPDGAPFARGINSFQLLHDGKRWWIVTIFWEQESEASKIPEEYLKTKGD
jgi:hypothetical protein